jgi:two-component system, NarL family, response regulator NreC
MTDISIKVIIADDHPIFRSGLNSVLSQMPFVRKVSEAGDGQAAVDLLKKELHDVILMDISMQPMGGIEATSIITVTFPGTKVIALSMHDDEKNIIAMIDNGATGYLLKNADKDEIEEALRKVMAGKKYFSKEVSTLLVEYYQQKLEENIYGDEKTREEIFLICNEFSSQEIGELLFQSARTIEKHRRKIHQVTNTKNLLGLLRYAMENKILDDEELNQKFAKALLKKRAEKKE